jgi:hypothetical protein
MNERIRELYEQARLQAKSIDADIDPKGWMDLYHQKFAELLVKECMRQVEEQYLPVLEDETMMKDTHWGGYVQCGVDSYVAIREHFFGVEE